MKTTVVVFSRQPQCAFIASTLYTDSLHTLRIGKKAYKDIVEGIECLSGGQWIYAKDKCPTAPELIVEQVLKILAEKGSYLQPKDKVLIYNLTYFPLDYEWFEHLLSKAMATDIPTWICHTSGHTDHLALMCLTYEQLQYGLQDAEPAMVRAQDNQLADLTDTETVLRLFSSGFSLRYFNSLQTSREVFFMKQSNAVKKMQAEYAFFQNVPSVIRPYFPHVGDITQGENKAGYEIEVIPCLDVAKSLFNGVFADEAKSAALVKLLGAYLKACPRKAVSAQEYQECAQSFFIEKTNQRMADMLKLDNIELFNEVCRLNGFASFEAFAKAYIELLRQDIAAHPEKELAFSHGDLFFSNILFDPTKYLIKLIDPKGMPDGDIEKTYMPAWYDLAKLSHSFLGQYDLMVYDQVDVVMQKDMTLGLKSAHISGLDGLKRFFQAYLKQNSIDVKRLRLYEGSLFLSMLPLHADDPLRMQRQLIRAMELYRFAAQKS